MQSTSNSAVLLYYYYMLEITLRILGGMPQIPYKIMPTVLCACSSRYLTINRESFSYC